MISNGIHLIHINISSLSPKLCYLAKVINTSHWDQWNKFWSDCVAKKHFKPTLTIYWDWIALEEMMVSPVVCTNKEKLMKTMTVVLLTYFSRHTTSTMYSVQTSRQTGVVNHLHGLFEESSILNMRIVVYFWRQV